MDQTIRDKLKLHLKKRREILKDAKIIEGTGNSVKNVLKKSIKKRVVVLQKGGTVKHEKNEKVVEEKLTYVKNESESLAKNKIYIKKERLSDDEAVFTREKNIFTSIEGGMNDFDEFFLR